MLKAIQRLLTILLFAIIAMFLVYQALLYSLARSKMPVGMMIADVDVSGMTREEAATAVQQQYLAPIGVHHNDERIALNPADLGFVIDIEAMLNEAEAYREQLSWEEGYLQFVLNRALDPSIIPLQATHDREAIRTQIENIAAYLDRPASAPQLVASTGDYVSGESGYVTDVEASIPEVEAALYQADRGNREASLILEYQDSVPLNLEVLETQLRQVLNDADGVIGSVFVMDLQTGEEIGINEGVALSGLSILKIAIFVEAYRALDRPPNDYELGLFYDTAVKSSNFGANLLLHVIAGEDNTYQGAAVLTESLHRLGMVNTFMAVPYDAPEVDTRPSTYTTPANSDPGLITEPDPARQATAEDIGSLLAMIYHCSKGGGSLMAVYPDQFTPEECQAIIDLMVLNEEGNLIRFGVPEEVPVSHKHGWDGTTYGDAGIVFSPGGDYVIVTYVTQPGGWLASSTSFPILWELSRLTYNYFNLEDPYLEDPNIRAESAVATREAELAAENETAENGEIDAEGTAVPEATSTP